MRVFIALLLTAACATFEPPTPDSRVAGCWISRDDAGSATTMRWLPDPARPGALRGDKLAYTPEGAGQSEQYRLEPIGAQWSFCQIEAAGERCWSVAEGEEGSLEGGRAFIDAHHESLRISVIGDGADRIVFEGARDGCD